jgi:hypothetical protein
LVNLPFCQPAILQTFFIYLPICQPAISSTSHFSIFFIN